MWRETAHRLDCKTAHSLVNSLATSSKFLLSVSPWLDHITERDQNPIGKSYAVLGRQAGLGFFQVRADSRFADTQQSDDFAVLVALNHQAKHLSLTAGQRVSRGDSMPLMWPKIGRDGRVGVLAHDIACPGFRMAPFIGASRSGRSVVERPSQNDRR